MLKPSYNDWLKNRNIGLTIRRRVSDTTKSKESSKVFADSSILDRSKEYSLARTEADIMINDCNGLLLVGWRENIDIQAIINQYSPTLDYICGYTTKCKTSKTKKALFDDMKGNEKSMSEWNLSLSMMNARQAGIPECCDILLGHQLFGFDCELQKMEEQ
ncbi:unnamed protein product [Caenorhabditis brenneri]